MLSFQHLQPYSKCEHVLLLTFPCPCLLKVVRRQYKALSSAREICRSLEIRCGKGGVDLSLPVGQLDSSWCRNSKIDTPVYGQRLHWIECHFLTQQSTKWQQSMRNIVGDEGALWWRGARDGKVALLQVHCRCARASWQCWQASLAVPLGTHLRIHLKCVRHCTCWSSCMMGIALAWETRTDLFTRNHNGMELQVFRVTCACCMIGPSSQ